MADSRMANRPSASQANIVGKALSRFSVKLSSLSLFIF